MLFVKKMRGKWVFARQIISTQPPTSGNYEYEEGIMTHVGVNSLLPYFKYDF
jgi:hypothetical protein